MKQIICESCGSNDFTELNGYRICQYCKAKFLLHHDVVPKKGTSIALNEDIRMLLRKCKEDPANARRYANLVLDIDPSNKEANKYLR